MIGISSQLLLAKNLNILHIFGEYPTKLENIKFSNRRWEYLEIRTQSPPALFVHLQDTAAQTSPHESEAGNVKDVFAIVCLSNFLGR
jgi:hypothetical protein